MNTHKAHRYRALIASVVVGLAATFGLETSSRGETPIEKSAGTSVYHVPLADASASEELTVVAQVAAGWTSRLELQIRSVGKTSWKSITFERTGEAEYIAVIPGELMTAPSVEYFISGASREGQRLHFASPEHPHRVYVYKEEEVEIREQELERFHGRRAQVSLSTEVVDFGTRTIVDRGTNTNHEVRDSYYRIDTSVTYRLMRYPLRALRFGYSRLIGTTPTTSRGSGMCTGTGDAICEQSAGYRAGGWVETQWRLGELLNLDTRALIQATPK